MKGPVGSRESKVACWSSFEIPDDVAAQQRIAAAEGEAIQLQGETLRSNPAVLQLRAIEKWNGRLPTVPSGATPFVQIRPGAGD